MDNRLLHAKNLLKKYQNKQNTITNNRNENNFNGIQEQKVQSTSSESNLINTVINNNSSRRSSFLIQKTAQNLENSNEVVNNNNQDNNVRLNTLLLEKEKLLNETQLKLHELHLHYTKLYAAYNNIVKSDGSKNDLLKYTLQISQLQTALTVATEEKTNLQIELNNLKTNIEDLKNNNPQSLQILLSKTEAEINQLKEEEKRLYETIANQCATIEEHRKKCSNLEAKILLINQDRNETQIRLKYLFEDKVELEKKIKELENVLNMREIYIRQLTRATETNPIQDQLVIQTLTDEKNKFQEEVKLKENEINELKKQLDSTRSHYDSCIADMSQQILTLEKEAFILKSKKNEIESKKIYQEEQLRLMQDTLKANLNSQSKEESTEKDVKTVNYDEHTALLNNYSSLQDDFLRCCNKVQDLESTIEQKDAQFESLQYEFINAQRKVANLENSIQLQNSLNLDVKTLSEQLQNEKATVSRAVAQNLDLKKQLKELQDKIVKVTNECMAKEDERLTIAASLEKLKKELENLYLANEKKENDNKQNFNDKIFDNNKESHISIENSDITIVNDNMNKTDEIIEKDSTKFNPFTLDQNTEEKKQNIKSQEAVINSDKKKNLEDNKSNYFNCPLTPPSTPVDTAKHIYNQSVITNSYVEEKLKPFINQQNNNFIEKTCELKKRLEAVLEENENFRSNNKKLEYWLTFLEAENENIGEYIAIYRYQRSNIEKKIHEKDLKIKELQRVFKKLHYVALSFRSNYNDYMQKKITSNTNEFCNKNNLLIEPNNTLENEEKNNINNASDLCVNQKENSVTSDFENKFNLYLADLNSLILDILEDIGMMGFDNFESETENNTKTSSQLLNNLECAGKNNTEKNSLSLNITECSGCVECRGELFTL